VTVQPNYSGENMVFVVGCPRSGTTWVQRLLSCHPQVHTGQESNLFSDFIGAFIRKWNKGLALRERGGVGLACYFTETEMVDVLRGLMCTVLRRMLQPLRPGELFVEKTPDHARYLPEIARFLPAARIIHVLRDPRDVVASLLAASRTWAQASGWAPRHARDAAMLWTQIVGSVRKYSATADPKKFLELRYEELYEQPLAVLARTRDFIGLKWSKPEMRAALEANRIPGRSRSRTSQSTIPLSGEAALVSGHQVIDPEGFLRKGRPSSWKTDLSLAERNWVRRVARERALQCGYGIRWFR
jgi:hypothetical protein